jgi:hypothetical protein
MRRAAPARRNGDGLVLKISSASRVRAINRAFRLALPVLGKCSSTITRPLSPAADMPLHWVRSEKCHNRTSCTAPNDMQGVNDLLNDLVGGSLQGHRNGKAEVLCGFKVDH